MATGELSGISGGLGSGPEGRGHHMVFLDFRKNLQMGSTNG